MRKASFVEVWHCRPPSSTFCYLLRVQHAILYCLPQTLLILGGPFRKRPSPKRTKLKNFLNVLEHVSSNWRTVYHPIKLTMWTIVHHPFEKLYLRLLCIFISTSSLSHIYPRSNLNNSLQWCSSFIYLVFIPCSFMYFTYVFSCMFMYFSIHYECNCSWCSQWYDGHTCTVKYGGHTMHSWVWSSHYIRKRYETRTKLRNAVCNKVNYTIFGM